MKKILFIVAVALTSATTASAGCYGWGNWKNCSDGNSYTTLGNTTFGFNNNTGSTWNQTTTGGFTYGTNSSGNAWWK